MNAVEVGIQVLKLSPEVRSIGSLVCGACAQSSESESAGIFLMIHGGEIQFSEICTAVMSHVAENPDHTLFSLNIRSCADSSLLFCGLVQCGNDGVNVVELMPEHGDLLPGNN